MTITFQESPVSMMVLQGWHKMWQGGCSGYPNQWVIGDMFAVGRGINPVTGSTLSLIERKTQGDTMLWVINH